MYIHCILGSLPKNVFSTIPGFGEYSLMSIDSHYYFSLLKNLLDWSIESRFCNYFSPIHVYVSIFHCFRFSITFFMLDCRSTFLNSFIHSITIFHFRIGSHRFNFHCFKKKIMFHTILFYFKFSTVLAPVVRAFAHGAMGRRIDPSWGVELFLVQASALRLV